MPSTCVFEFDRPQPVYYSGETINGRITLTTTSEKSVREAYILFEGQAKVHWTETRTKHENGRSHTRTVHFRATENYLYTKTNVHGEGTMPPGNYSYTFSIPLPIGCPTSCEEEYGQVRYELSLVLNRPFRFDNVFKNPLTVLHQVDLNLRPELLVPIKNEDVKYFCCWPCSSGPVLSTLTIPFGGYAPGQDIKYRLEIDNQAHGYDLEDGIRLKLVQTYRFTAHSPYVKTRSHPNTLSKVELSMRCLRLSKRVIEGVLTVPAVPPTSNDGGIIGVTYDFKIIIDTGACHTDAEVSIPITIGTVPLMQSATNPEHAWAIQPTAPDTPGTPPLAGNLPPAYDNYKPPSFEEAVSTGGKFVDPDEDDRHRTDFVPKYPMYTNFAMPTSPSFDNDNSTTPQTALLATINSSAPPPQPNPSLPYPIGGPAMPQPSQLPTQNTTGYGWSTNK